MISRLFYGLFFIMTKYTALLPFLPLFNQYKQEKFRISLKLPSRVKSFCVPQYIFRYFPKLL